MAKHAQSKLVADLLASINRTGNGDAYIGMRVYGRADTAHADIHGTVTNTGLCQLDGCGGTRLHVLWPDGKRTYPCLKACTVRDNGDLEIS